MRPPRVLVVVTAVTLGAALSALPAQMASAQSPNTEVVVPSSGATLAGTQVVFDATASAGVTQVQFQVTVDNTLYARVLATPTIYGWIARLEQHHSGRRHLHPPERRHRRWFKRLQPRHFDHCEQREPERRRSWCRPLGPRSQETRPCSTPSPHRG